MVYQLKMYTPPDPEWVLYNYMYIAWLTATANVCPVTLNQYGGWGKGTHQHFIYMYMLQRPGHILK